ncbi:MAG: peptidoglycan DD-metalloendopeptidase family protein [Bacteroidota bacterium]
MNLESLINQLDIHPIIKPEIPNDAWHVFDFTKNNTALQQVDLKEQGSFENYINQTLAQGKQKGGAGGYLEERVLYQRSAHFDGEEEARSLHLGIDLWLPADTSIFAPINGIIHSYANNHGFGNYGPTLIIEHDLKGIRFYTLYGHLSLSSFYDWKVGAGIKGGQQIASLGAWPENGNWPPHLHFQVMTDMLDWVGDFPGVAAPSEKEYWSEICLDPSAFLNIESLRK